MAASPSATQPNGSQNPNGTWAQISVEKGFASKAEVAFGCWEGAKAAALVTRDARIAVFMVTEQECNILIVGVVDGGTSDANSKAQQGDPCLLFFSSNGIFLAALASCYRTMTCVVVEVEPIKICMQIDEAESTARRT